VRPGRKGSPLQQLGDIDRCIREAGGAGLIAGVKDLARPVAGEVRFAMHLDSETSQRPLDELVNKRISRLTNPP